MKKFLLSILMSMIVLFSSSCGTTNYLSQRTVSDMDEVSYVLYNYYPQLHTYYMEGVLRVNSIREITLNDGNIDYKVKYDFIRYYYRNYSEKMEVLKEYYPELYQMYLNGVIEISSIYKYVDRNTGKIRHHISYRRIYDYSYNYYPGIYGGYHIYYRPRPIPVRPAPPRVNPTPQPKPQPNIRPNNNSREGSPRVSPNQPNNRPNNSVQRNQPQRNSGGGQTRSSVGRNTGGGRR